MWCVFTTWILSQQWWKQWLVRIEGWLIHSSLLNIWLEMTFSIVGSAFYALLLRNGTLFLWPWHIGPLERVKSGLVMAPLSPFTSTISCFALSLSPSLSHPLSLLLPSILHPSLHADCTHWASHSLLTESWGHRVSQRSKRHPIPPCDVMWCDVWDGYKGTERNTSSHPNFGRHIKHMTEWRIKKTKPI